MWILYCFRGDDVLDIALDDDDVGLELDEGDSTSGNVSPVTVRANIFQDNGDTESHVNDTSVGTNSLDMDDPGSSSTGRDIGPTEDAEDEEDEEEEKPSRSRFLTERKPIENMDGGKPINTHNQGKFLFPTLHAVFLSFFQLSV